MTQTHDELAQWEDAVAALNDQVEQWVSRKGWATHRSQKQLSESSFGAYTVPVLNVKTPGGEIHLEAVARRVAGADGRVDLYAWPSLARFMIVRQRGAWVIKTDSGVDWPAAWGEQTVIDLIERLASEA